MMWTTVKKPAKPIDGLVATAYREAAAPVALAPARSGEIGRTLVADGYVYVGARVEHTVVGSFTSDVFVHPQGVALVLVRPRRVTLDPGVLAMSHYWIHTFFDDGVCMETSGRGAGASGVLLIARAGTDAITADLASHVDAALARAKDSSHEIVPVRTIADVKRVSEHFQDRCAPVSVVLNLAVIAAVTVGFAIAMVVRIFFWIRK